MACVVKKTRGDCKGKHVREGGKETRKRAKEEAIRNTRKGPFSYKMKDATSVLPVRSDKTINGRCTRGVWV